MSYSELLLPEFEIEMARTRKILAKVPADKLAWQADNQLRTIGWNANHIADSVGWTRNIIEENEFDIAPVDGPKHETPSLDDPNEIVASFDRNVADARNALSDATDEKLSETWELKAGGETISTMIKRDCLRTWIMNHIIHHRAILSVYLRMVSVELTPVYDE